MLGDGAARGATPGPCRARRSRKIHRLPSPFSPRHRILSREHSPPHHLLAALVCGALFAVSPQLYYRPTLYVGLILRHPSSYASFAPLPLQPRTLLPTHALSRSFIAFFIPRVIRVYVAAASRFFITYLPPFHILHR